MSPHENPQTGAPASAPVSAPASSVTGEGVSEPVYVSSRTRVAERNLFWQVLGELASVRTAALLIALIGIVSWIAAYYERDYGMAAAHVLFYQAWWFNLIFVFIAIAVVGAVAVRWPLQRRQTGFAIVHAGLITLIVGFWLGADRLDGMLAARPGQAAQLIELPTDEVQVLDPGATQSWRTIFQPLAFAGYPSPLRYVLSPLWPISAPGLHTLAEPLTLATMPSGTEVRVTRVVDTGGAELSWIPAIGNTEAEPATHLTLAIKPPMAKDYQDMGGQWLTPSGDGLFSRGPFTATMARTREPLLVDDFLKPVDETTAHGRLLMYWKGQRHELAIDPTAMPQQVTLDGASITVVRLITNPTHTNDTLEQDATKPANPVVELTVSAGAQQRTLFASAYSLLPPIAGMPDLLFSHPQLADPVGGGQGAYVQLLVGPDARLHTRCFTRSDGAGPVVTVGDQGWTGSVAGGAAKAMDLRLTLRHLPQAIRGPDVLLMQTSKMDRATRWLELEVRHGNASVRRWVSRGDRIPVLVPGFGEVLLSYRKALYDLKERNGFTVVLDHFEAGKDPGGMGNATYSSTVTVKPISGEPSQHLITMNEPLHYAGVTLYQTAFTPEFDEQGNPTGKQVSIFTAAEDAGRLLKYLGSLVLVAGILVMYFMRR